MLSQTPSSKKGKFRSLILEILSTKKSNSKRSKSLIKEIRKSINQESLIIQLRAEFNHLKNLNINYLNYLSIIKRLKELYYTNKEGIKKYCHFIKTTYKDKIEIIDNFEEKVKEKREDKKYIIYTNDNIIKIKNEEGKIFNIKLLEMNEKIRLNSEEIDKQKLKINTLENQMIEERNLLLKNEENQMKKYKTLKYNYDILSQLCKEKKEEIENFKETKPVELENKEIRNQLIKEENQNIKLNEEKIKNQNLLEEVRNLSMKISKLSTYSELSTRRFTKYTKSTTRSPFSIKKLSLFK